MPVEPPSRDDLRLVRRTLEALPGVAEAEVLLIGDGPGAAVSALVSDGRPLPEPSVAAPPSARLDDGETRVVPGCLAAMERAAVLAIAHTVHTVQTTGLFRHGAEEVADALRAAPRHRWIVRRWLAALASENLPAPPSRQELARAMRDLDAARQELGYPAEMGRFFQTALRSLPRLVRDEISLQSLLFAGGGMTAARGNYRDNLISRRLNRAAAEAVAARAPARVLEIGAGVGATTDAVLAAVGEVDYLFTDVSAFFLDAARERFAHRTGLRYAHLDVNAPMALDEQPFDVVLAANVLHNARHAGRTLAAIRELLAPGGTLVLIESCVEHHLVSASMHFLMSPRADALLPGFADVRQGQDRVFLTRTEWILQLAAAGYRDLRVEPAPDGPLAAAGQHVFTAVRGERHPAPAPLPPEAAEALPPHLVPREIHTVDALITDRSHRP
ncbi:class I SAM-dependent methyltransferase [Nonomuraea pusilla]|uniref:Ubiquinone/menaquinone biosynthesis C-methylase UbiE n=1 Tax=Nonomuraea pusilla TaxID=46177 RepID=A0A1H7X6X6_9ACTN|nr:class I SAM-dependent methyltransferase [Nonomuraea pusilla]SEM29431.1 Ubiquinone/menaquinone biosynthesis C-methylase UbiE [Nonomuraea pusilla]